MEILHDLSLLIGIWVAIYGIDAWRRAHVGKRAIDLAEETLALFFEAQDAISHIRSPLGFSTETDGVEQNEGESDERFDARRKASVVFYRYNQHSETFNMIRALRYRFMAQIGRAKAKPFDDLFRVIHEIQGAAHMLASLWTRQSFRNGEEEAKYEEQLRKYENVFWSMSPENDEISSRVEALVSEIESTCQGIIMGKGTLFAWLNWSPRNPDPEPKGTTSD